MPSQDRRLAEAVAAIYAAATAPVLWPQTLEAVAAVFEDAGANLFYVRDDGSYGIVVTPSLVETQRDYDAGWWREDIRTTRAIEYGYTEGVDAKTDRHIASDDEIANHPYYRDFLRPHGLGWFAGVPISPDPRTALAMTVHRSAATKPPYSDEELALATWLGRHAEHALRLSARLLTAEMAAIAFGEALTRLDVGVFLVTGAGTVVVANRIAESLIGDMLTVSQGRLAAPFEPERSLLQQAIEQTVASDPSEPHGVPRPVVLQGASDNGFAVAYVLPVRTIRDHPLDRALSDANAIVVVRRGTRAEPIDPALVRDLLSLTLGEARVAALVGAGMPPKDAAVRLGIAEQTVRTVLKRVFAKTGISRQSDLAGLLTRLVLR
ncbi:MAG TPA: helix-turn-helix transcriptional regulator [Bauldia sp.]|nr:helix-turn-helix transcriptional regulator [Bauldia sp.]